MSNPPEDDARRMEPTEVLPSGHLVDGKYRLGRLIGEGGMGAVYEAEHTGLGAAVAIKLLNEGFTTDQKAVSRFRREGRAAAAIRHENIVAVYDTGTSEQGVPFLVMELLDGESLSSFLRRERAVSPKVAAAIAVQILAGLGAAHSKKVVHRDLKPGNVLLAKCRDGSRAVKILDFGISKFYSDMESTDVTATGAVVGTPRFMAPEQARGQVDLDARVDLYAVGVLLYRMVTGRMPVAGRTQQEIIATILAGNPPTPREITSEVPPELDRVIMRALAVDRDERYQTAAEFAEDLRSAMPEVATGEPIYVSAVADSIQGSDRSPRSSGNSSVPSLVAVDRRESTRYDSPMALHQARRRQRRALTLYVSLLVVVIVGVSLVVWRVARGPMSGIPQAYSAIAGARFSGKPIRFGITRYLPRDRLLEEHDPIIRYLARRLHRRVELHIMDDYVDLAAKLEDQELDIAGLAAYAYVRATELGRHVKLVATHVTLGGSSYEGFILSRAGSGIRTLSGLRGKVFCYVNPGSSSGYLYPRALFRRSGMDPDTSFKATRFAADHLAALRALYSGACDGAAVFAGMLFYEAQEHGLPPEQFTILARTDRIPHDAYCVGEHLPAKTAKRLTEALLELAPKSETATRVLGPESRIQGFVAASDKDYDSVRKIAHYLDENRRDKRGRAATEPRKNTSR